SFQPLSKFSSLGGNFRSRYFSRGNCDHPVAVRTSRPASTSRGGLSPGTNRFMVYPPGPAPPHGSRVLPKALAPAPEDAAPRVLHHIKCRKALADEGHRLPVGNHAVAGRLPDGDGCEETPAPPRQAAPDSAEGRVEPRAGLP